jgi:hypothetical protein
MTGQAQATSHIKPTSLIAGTMVTSDIKRCRRMLEGALGMQCVEPAKGRMLARDTGYGKGEAKHGQPYWLLEIRETADIEVPQEMLNHWGVACPSQAAVDEAFEKLNANKEEFGIARVQKPRFRHGSYAVYFVDKDSNWWEVEYRTPDLVYTALRARGDQVHD